MLSFENSGKPLGDRSSAPNPAGGAHSAPQDPLSWWGGVVARPKEPGPRSRPSVLVSSQR